MTATATRTFGIELEATNVSRRDVERQLSLAGINCRTAFYSDSCADSWRIKTDSSIRGTNTFELASPILQGQDGLDQVEIVCGVLDRLNARVNKSCGIHVHVGARDLGLAAWKSMALRYQQFENQIDAFMPVSRRRSNNSYIKSLSALDTASIQGASSIDRLRAAFQGDRYHKLNLESFPRHGTVEFRQHSGSTEAKKITMWIQFCLNFVEASAAATTTASNNPYRAGSKLNRFFTVLDGRAYWTRTELAELAEIKESTVQYQLHCLRRDGYTVERRYTRHNRSYQYRVSTSQGTTDVVDLWANQPAAIQGYYAERAEDLAN